MERYLKKLLDKLFIGYKYFIVILIAIVLIFGGTLAILSLVFDGITNNPSLLIIILLAIVAYFSPSPLNKKQRSISFMLILLATFFALLGSTSVIFSIIVLISVIAINLYQFISIQKKISTDIYIIDQMDGREFEIYLANLFRKKYYQVELTKAAGDFGADLIITDKKGTKIAVQAKRYSNNVGNDAVNQVIGGKYFYKAHRAMVITNSYFTPQAIEQARSSSVELWDRDTLIKEINSVYNDDSYIDAIKNTIINGFKIRDYLFSILLIASIFALTFIPTVPIYSPSSTYGQPNVSITQTPTIKQPEIQYFQFTVKMAYKEDVGEEIIFLNPEDMQQMNLTEGQAIELSSPTAQIMLPIKSHVKVQPGILRVQSTVREKLNVDVDDVVTIKILTNN